MFRASIPRLVRDFSRAEADFFNAKPFAISDKPTEKSLDSPPHFHNHQHITENRIIHRGFDTFQIQNRRWRQYAFNCAALA
jgi:hypothetical protein